MKALARAVRSAFFLQTSLVACAACGGGSPAEPVPVPQCTFANPLASGQDPWVVKLDGAYYYIQSRSNGIWVSKSTKLSDVIAATPTQVWTAPPAPAWNATNVWAPELHFVDGRWYIYYAAGTDAPGAPFIHQYAGVLASRSADPQGAYDDKGMLYTGDDIVGKTGVRWAIDLTVARLGTQLYAVWSGWERDTTSDRTPQHLYIATMSDPITISSNRVKLSSPVAPWEIGPELDLQEGPEFIQHGTDVFVLYSTRDSWLKEYQIGQLKLQSAAADPMNPANWTKSTGPVFSGNASVYGVGHASFTTSPDNAESWIVYHSKVSATPGWDRDIRMQKFTWSAAGEPVFGDPVPAGVKVTRPAGECP
jgi:GH43 family beta-xylosidase